MIMVKILLWIWQLPQHVVGLILLGYYALTGGVTPRKRTMVICGKVVTVYYWTSERMQGGISLDILYTLELRPTLAEMLTAGYTIILKSSNALNHIRHEYGHTRQSRRLGPLYLLIVGLPSIVWAGIYRWMVARAKPGTVIPEYRSAPWERWADWLAGLK